MSRKIAIITSRDVWYNYGDDHVRIIDSITDWEEISDENYNLLQKARSRLGHFEILEMPTEQENFIAKTIAQYLTLAEEDAKKAEAEKKKREEAALARKHKKDLKDKESKLKLLKKLQEELGEEAKI